MASTSSSISSSEDHTPTSEDVMMLLEIDQKGVAEFGKEAHEEFGQEVVPELSQDCSWWIDGNGVVQVGGNQKQQKPEALKKTKKGCFCFRGKKHSKKGRKSLSRRYRKVVSSDNKHPNGVPGTIGILTSTDTAPGMADSTTSLEFERQHIFYLQDPETAASVSSEENQASLAAYSTSKKGHKRNETLSTIELSTGSTGSSTSNQGGILEEVIANMDVSDQQEEDSDNEDEDWFSAMETAAMETESGNSANNLLGIKPRTGATTCWLPFGKKVYGATISI